jgi:hypothetical protein
MRICIQSFKKMLKRAKKNFSSKIQYEYQTIKKVISKTVKKYALFPLLLMFVKLVSLIDSFLMHLFTTFSTDLKSA